MRKRCSLFCRLFFEDERGVTHTVHTERYLNNILKPFWEIKQRERMGMKRVWMEQDGATPQIAGESMAWLEDRFFGRLISLKWCAPHSPDLSPLHVFSRSISRIELTRRNHEWQKLSRPPSQPKVFVFPPRWSTEPSVTRRPCGCRS